MDDEPKTICIVVALVITFFIFWIYIDYKKDLAKDLARAKAGYIWQPTIQGHWIKAEVSE